MRISVTYDKTLTHSERSGERYGEWSEDWSCSVTGAYRLGDDEKSTYNSETFLVSDDATEVFVVYMIYSSGDSFGTASGMIDIIHCTSNEESADKLAKYITENTDEYTIKFTDEFDREISLHNPGAGYFERISYVGVERFAICSGKIQRRYYVN